MDINNPNSGEITTITLAELYEKEGQLEKAADIYRKIVSKEPDNDAVRRRLRELDQRLRRRRSHTGSNSSEGEDVATEEIPMTGNLMSSLERVDDQQIDRGPAAGDGDANSASERRQPLSPEEKKAILEQLEKFRDQITRWSRKVERISDGGNS